MGWTLDIIRVLLLAVAALAFVVGMRTFASLAHVAALYWLGTGALVLKVARDLRPPADGL